MFPPPLYPSKTTFINATKSYAACTARRLCSSSGPAAGGPDVRGLTRGSEGSYKCVLRKAGSAIMRQDPAEYQHAPRCHAEAADDVARPAPRWGRPAWSTAWSGARRHGRRGPESPGATSGQQAWWSVSGRMRKIINGSGLVRARNEVRKQFSHGAESKFCHYFCLPPQWAPCPTPS